VKTLSEKEEELGNTPMTYNQRISLYLSLFLMLNTPHYTSAQSVLDPIHQDPTLIDTTYPPTMDQITIVSEGHRMVGVIYIAQGQGPNPTVLLLHGTPGNEKNFDLAQAMRRAGWNVVVFHYRGSWGSEGNYSFSNCIEDSKAALAFLRDPETAQKYRVDSSNITLIGHSFGGFIALLLAQSDPQVQSVAAIAGSNFSTIIKERQLDTEEGFESAVKYFTEVEWILRGIDGKPLINEIITHKEEWDLLNYADQLAKKSVLLIGGTRDQSVPANTHVIPLADAIAAQGGTNIQTSILDSDHAFSDKRIELTETILTWLNTLQSE
jgi:uncharacterized protein